MNFNSPIKANIKQKIASNLIFLFLIVFLVFYFAIYSAIRDIKKLRGEIIAEKIEIEKKANREQNLSSLAIKLKQIESDSDKIDSIFIPKNDELEFIKTLEGIASHYSVEQTINLLADKDKPTEINKTIINIDVEGEYNNVLDYLKNIESLSYYININYISIAEKKTIKDEKEISMAKLNLGAETFWK